MDRLRRRPDVPLLLGAAVLLGGCGGAATTSTPAAPPARVASAATPATTATTPPLVAYEHRYGTEAVTEDVTIARGGAVTVIRFAGGGGRREQRCRLGATELAGLRARLRRLPVPSRDHPAADQPDRFTLTTARFSQTEVTGTLPRAFVRVKATFDDLLRARTGHCETTDQSR